MGMEFFLFRGTLNNVTTSFDDAAFTGLALKSSRINFTTKGGVSCCLSPVKDITNSSILNSQMIATNYCYQLLLQISLNQETASSQGFERGCIRQW